MRGVSVTRRALPGGDIVEITHRASDPGMWIVRRRRKTFFGMKDISSNWFSIEADAEAFAGAGAGIPLTSRAAEPLSFPHRRKS